VVDLRERRTVISYPCLGDSPLRIWEKPTDRHALFIVHLLLSSMYTCDYDYNIQGLMHIHQSLDGGLPKLKIIRVKYLHFRSPPSVCNTPGHLPHHHALTMPKKLKLPSLPPLHPLIPHSLNLGTKLVTREEVKKGIPFFRDPDHTIPTRALYRSLIRCTRSNPLRSDDIAPSESESSVVDWGAIRRNIREEWKKRKGLTSIPQTKSFLAARQDLLQRLFQSNPEIIQHSKTLASRQVAADKRALPPPIRKPYLAGYLRPTHFNPPLPRLKPQPLSITLMIKKRIAARARRLEYQRANTEVWNDIHSEMGLMRRLHEREGLEEMKGFRDEMEVLREGVQRGYERDEGRKGVVFGYGVVRRVEKARRGRQEWKRVKAGERARGEQGQIVSELD
jgi:hypothetical protein